MADNRPLGPFEVGEAPLLTATIIPLDDGISTGCTWYIRDPEGTETTISSPNNDIANPTANVWTYQMPVITIDGVYWVRCTTTAGVLASKTHRLGVVEDPFEVAGGRE
jgi:hypothetical protein